MRRFLSEAVAALLALGFAAPASAQAFELSAQMTGNRAPLSANFQAKISPDLEAFWDFGDGNTARGASVQHTFYRPGNYQVNVALRRGADLVGRGRLDVAVPSAGAEQAALTVLLGEGGTSALLSGAGSVVYSPYTPQFSLNGQVLPSNAAALKLGSNQTAAIKIARPGAQPLARTVQFKTPRAAYGGSRAAEDQALAEINRLRTSGYNCATGRFDGPRRAPLTRQPQLDRAALAQAAAMPTANFVGHVSPLDGSTPQQRIEASGYRARASAENVAGGQPTPQAAVDAWVKSPGHCSALTGNYVHTGLAYVNAPGSTYGHYWAQVFAMPF